MPLSGFRWRLVYNVRIWTTPKSKPVTTNPTPEAAPRDLFEADAEGWRAHPDKAFDVWMARHGFSHATAVVYRSMWGKLLRWSGERGLAPLSWSAEQIGEFLDTHGLQKHHRYRYARLIERVFHHLSLQQAGLHNPASQAVRAHLAEGENDPTAFLLPAEREAIIARVLAPGLPVVPEGQAVSPTAWKRARDTALVAILLGAGLKVGEARNLRTDSLAQDASAVHFVRPDNGRAYDVPVFAFARQVILDWLAIRKASGALGNLAFPTMPDGKPMHAASLYRRVERLLDQAGILAGRSERASPQTLRNTYGAMHFEAGAGPASVAQYLGMRDLESGWRLRAAYEAWIARSGQLAQVAQTTAGDPNAP
jgi:integrase